MAKFVIEFEGRLDKLEAALRRVEGGLTNVATTTATSTAKATASFETMSRKIEASTNTVTQSMLRWGTAIASLATGGGIAALITKANEFEVALADVNTILDRGAPAIEKWGGALRELAKGSTRDVVDLTKGLYEAISSGAEQTMEAGGAFDILRIAQKAAVAGLGTTSEAVRAGTSVMNIFGKEAGTTTEIFDKMMGAVAGGMIHFPELAKEVGTLSTKAKAAGVSFDEMLAALVEVSKGMGGNVAEAATSLGALFQSLSAPGMRANKIIGEMNETIGGLGINLTKQAVTTKGLMGVIVDTEDKLNQAYGQSASKQKMLLQSGEARVAFNILARNNSLDYAKSLDKIGDSSGNVARMFRIQEVTATAMMQKLKNQFAELALQIKESFGSSGGSFMQSLSDAVAAFDVKTLIKELHTVAEAVVGVTKVVYGLRESLVLAVEVIVGAKIVTGMYALGTAATAVFGGIVTNLNKATNAVTLMSLGVGTATNAGSKLLTSMMGLAPLILAAIPAAHALGEALAQAAVYFGVGQDGVKGAAINVRVQKADLEMRQKINEEIAREIKLSSKDLPAATVGALIVANTVAVKRVQLAEQLALINKRIQAADLEHNEKALEASKFLLESNRRSARLLDTIDAEEIAGRVERFRLGEAAKAAAEKARQAQAEKEAADMKAKEDAANKPDPALAKAELDAKARLAEAELALQKHVTRGVEREVKARTDVRDEDAARYYLELNKETELAVKAAEAKRDAELKGASMTGVVRKAVLREFQVREKDALEQRKQQESEFTAWMKEQQEARGRDLVDAYKKALIETAHLVQEGTARYNLREGQHAEAFAQGGALGLAGALIAGHGSIDQMGSSREEAGSAIQQVGKLGVGGALQAWAGSNLVTGVQRIAGPENGGITGGWIQGAGEVLKGAAQLAGASFLSLVQAAGTFLYDKFAELVGMAINTRPGQFNVDLQAKFREGKLMVDNIVQNLPMLFQQLVPFIQQIGPKIAAALPPVIHALVRGMPQVIRAVLDQLPMLAAAVIHQLPAIMEMVAQQAGVVVGDLVKLASQEIGPLISAFVQGAAAALGSVIGDALKGKGLASSNLVRGAAIGAVAGSVIPGAGTLAGALVGGGLGFLADNLDIGGKVESYVKGGMVNRENAIMNRLRDAATGASGVPAIVHPGERVLTAQTTKRIESMLERAVGAGTGGNVEVHFNSKGSSMAAMVQRAFSDMFVAEVRRQGGTARTAREVAQPGFANLPGLTPLVVT